MHASGWKNERISNNQGESKKILRNQIKKILSQYLEIWQRGRISYDFFSANEERETTQTILDFVTRFDSCFDRSNTKGHITGSALVVDPNLEQVLLTLHAKLGIWIQLGGHADGNPDIAEVAMKEAREESGLGKLEFARYEELFGITTHPLPFDVDIHKIPERKNEPCHWHYDIRFLIVSPNQNISQSSESTDLRFFPLSEAMKVTREKSMHRQFHKLRAIRKAYPF